MQDYNKEYVHNTHNKIIYLRSNMLSKETAEFYLYVDGMMGCHLSTQARKLCLKIATKKD